MAERIRIPQSFYSAFLQQQGNAEHDRDTFARDYGQYGPDYDYRLVDPTDIDMRQHGNDIGKLPNHPTFSNQSFYSGPNYPGGEWSRDFIGNRFTPSARMWLQPGYRENINQYMQYADPDTRVFRPISEDIKK
jgi:hypothetical protein